MPIDAGVDDDIPLLLLCLFAVEEDVGDEGAEPILLGIAIQKSITNAKHFASESTFVNMSSFFLSPSFRLYYIIL